MEHVDNSMIEVSLQPRADGLHVLGDKLYDLIAVDSENSQRYHLGCVPGAPLDYALLKAALPPQAARYRLLARSNDSNVWQPVFLANSHERRPWQRYYRGQSGGDPEPLHIFADAEGRLGIRVRADIFLDHGERRFDYEHDLLDLELRNGSLRGAFNLEIREAGDFVIESIQLRLHSTREIVAVIGSHSVDERQAQNTRVTFSVPLSEGLQLVPLRYVLYLAVKEARSGQEILLRINHLAQSLYEKLHARMLPQQLRLSKGRVLALATTPQTTLASFVVREAAFDDDRPIRTKASAVVALALVRLRQALKRPRKATALIFEKNASTAQDNGFALFSHLLQRKTAPGFDYYFVMDRTSEQWPRLAGLPRVVKKYSFKHWRLLASPTTFLLSSDVRYHLSHLHAQPGLLDKLLYLRRNYFLQHGVLGLKRIGILSRSSAVAPDATVVSAEWERELATLAGADQSSLDVTGLARWDCLIKAADQPPRPIKQILFMPTWRDWLEGHDPQELARSDFARDLVAFLSLPSLQKLLETHASTLNLLPHPKLASLSSLLGDYGERVKILRQDDLDFTTLINSMDVAITDYSSIAWDFVWAGKGVVLAQFDRRQHLTHPGEYSSPAFGEIMDSLPIAETPERLISELAHLLTEDTTKRNSRYEAYSHRVFPFHDSKNSSRIIQHVEARLSELQMPRRMPEYTDADAPYKRQQARSRS